MLKRLTTEDSDLLCEAFAWDRESPQWYRDMDRVFGPQTLKDFTALINDPLNCLLGIFAPEFTGLIIVTWGEEYSAHLWARRGTNRNILASHIEQVKQDMFGLGMETCNLWVADRNRGVKRLCEQVGFHFTGIVMYRGSYRGRVIKWCKYQLKKYSEPISYYPVRGKEDCKHQIEPAILESSDLRMAANS